jgi:uncharacterized protein
MVPAHRPHAPPELPADVVRRREEIHAGHRVRPFRPARWLPGSHFQTVVGKFLRSRSAPPIVRERVDTADGDFLDLDLSPDPGPDRPVVLVLHGLEGSSRRAYVRLAMREILRHGMRAVALNFRSCSGEPNRTARFYHSGETEDPGYVLELLRERFPSRPIGALGFSLGGNVLLKYLGEQGDAAGRVVSAAAAISVPFDLLAGTRAIESGVMGRIYTGYFLRSLRGKTDAKEALLAGLLDLDRVRAARTLREYDEVATAPLHGFPGAEAYYRAASSARFLREVRTPTLLLQARDDPFLPHEALPGREAALNPFLLPAFTEAGGHVGFVERSAPWRPAFWAEAEAARYLARLLDRRRGS